MLVDELDVLFPRGGELVLEVLLLRRLLLPPLLLQRNVVIEGAQAFRQLLVRA